MALLLFLGIFVVIVIVVVIAYRNEGMGYVYKSCGDCRGVCSCTPKGVTCNKPTEYCYRYSKFYDRGRYCGSACTGCGQSHNYNVTDPAVINQVIDVRAVTLPLDHPLGMGKPSTVWFPPSTPLCS